MSSFSSYNVVESTPQDAQFGKFLLSSAVQWTVYSWHSCTIFQCRHMTGTMEAMSKSMLKQRTQTHSHLSQPMNTNIPHLSSKSFVYDNSSLEKTYFINDFCSIDFSYLNNGSNIELSYDTLLKTSTN